MNSAFIAVIAAQALTNAVAEAPAPWVDVHRPMREVFEAARKAGIQVAGFSALPGVLILWRWALSGTSGTESTCIMDETGTACSFKGVEQVQVINAISAVQYELRGDQAICTAAASYVGCIRGASSHPSRSTH